MSITVCCMSGLPSLPPNSSVRRLREALGLRRQDLRTVDREGHLVIDALHPMAIIMHFIIDSLHLDDLPTS